MPVIRQTADKYISDSRVLVKRTSSSESSEFVLYMFFILQPTGLSAKKRSTTRLNNIKPTLIVNFSVKDVIFLA